jgi:hypothetical protein
MEKYDSQRFMQTPYVDPLPGRIFTAPFDLTFA